jgi:hypothetical protein
VSLTPQVLTPLTLVASSTKWWSPAAPAWISEREKLENGKLSFDVKHMDDNVALYLGIPMRAGGRRRQQARLWPPACSRACALAWRPQRCPWPTSFCTDR